MTPVARRLFDGHDWHDMAALVIHEGRVQDIVPATGPAEVPLIVPGFVDLQVNGGGGAQFNDSPTPEAIQTILAAHRKGGTTRMLVTLITDTPAITAAAIAAGRAALSSGQPGYLGLHLEGPHLDPRRKGTHDPQLIRPMTETDLARLITAAADCGHLLVTLAPEAATPAQIRALRDAGAQISLGHSDCSYETATEAFDAGADMVTHLFNAMSQMSHRAPGLVGAALDHPQVSCGLIADGHHVSDPAMGVALRGKAGPGRVFLVSDAMAATGSDLEQITLNGRTIYRADGRLTLADGTLAGADITMLDAVRYVHHGLGLPLDEALRMAALYPAQAIGHPGLGHLRPGAEADFLTLDDDLALQDLWIAGQNQEQEKGTQ